MLPQAFDQCFAQECPRRAYTPFGLARKRCEPGYG